MMYVRHQNHSFSSDIACSSPAARVHPLPMPGKTNFGKLLLVLLFGRAASYYPSDVLFSLVSLTPGLFPVQMYQ